MLSLFVCGAESIDLVQRGIVGILKKKIKNRVILKTWRKLGKQKLGDIHFSVFFTHIILDFRACRIGFDGESIFMNVEGKGRC
jgi:hypothetical protein